MNYIIYTDGSYKAVKGLGEFYSSAATIQREGESEPFTTLTKVSSDEFAKMHNVAGETLAAIMAFDHCNRVLRLTQKDTVEVRYDYAGIENWCKKKGQPDYWKATTELSQTYRDYVNMYIKTCFKVKFKHVVAHTGEKGNTRVDALAKEALNRHLQTLMQ